MRGKGKREGERVALKDLMVFDVELVWLWW